ncbi:hypothetical protein HRR86_007008 [Exophiala dermatitidis]|nr:hypothetical protein HRR82_006457 [Exophiala dermatitidis]KAJ4618438.1 hypothetical protein HRR86_007008 [Exophiala dermatitidis]
MLAAHLRPWDREQTNAVLCVCPTVLNEVPQAGRMRTPIAGSSTRMLSVALQIDEFGELKEIDRSRERAYKQLPPFPFLFLFRSLTSTLHPHATLSLHVARCSTDMTAGTAPSSPPTWTSAKAAQRLLRIWQFGQRYPLSRIRSEEKYPPLAAVMATGITGIWRRTTALT